MVRSGGSFLRKKKNIKYEFKIRRESRCLVIKKGIRINYKIFKVGKYKK